MTEPEPIQHILEREFGRATCAECGSEDVRITRVEESDVVVFECQDCGLVDGG